MEYSQKDKKEINIIISLYLLLFVLIIVAQLISRYEMRDIHASTTKIYQHPLQVSNAALKIEKNIHSIHRDMKDVVLSKSKKELSELIQKVDKSETDVYKQLSIIEKHILGQEGLELQQKMHILFKEWKPIRDEVISLVENNKKAKAESITKEKGARHVEKMEKFSQRLYLYASKKALEFKDHSTLRDQELREQSFYMDIVFFVIYLLVLFYTISRIKRYISKNIHTSNVLSIIRDINQLIVRENSVEDLFKRSCKILTSKNVFRYAFIISFDADNNVEYIIGSDESKEFEIFSEKIKNNWNPNCINNSDNVFSYTTWNEENCLACPISDLNKCQNTYSIKLNHNNKIYGYLNIDIQEKYLDETELSLLEEVSGDIAYAIYSSSLQNELAIKEKRYQELVDNTQSAVAIYKPQKNGQEFIFLDFNHAAEKIENIPKASVIGKSVKEVFPTIDSFGLLDVLKRVCKTGVAENFTLKQYKDDRISGWRENYVYKLHSGEIVAVYLDKTHEVNLKSELQKSLERFKIIVEGTTDGIWDWDIKTNELYLSPRWKEQLGYADNELENRFETWDNLLNPKDKEKTYIDIKDSQEGKTKLYKNIHRLKHKDGHWVWIEARGSTIFDENGKAIRMIGSNTDITEQKKISNELMLNKTRYEKAEIIGKVGSWEYIIETKEFWVSDESKRIYGFPVDSSSLSTEQVERCIPERKRVHQALIDLIENNKEYNLEFEINPMDGSKLKTILSIAELEFDEFKKPVKVVGFIQDITEQKKAKKALFDLKELYDNIINSIDNVLFVKDTEFNYIACNRAFCEFVGKPKEEIIYKNDFDLFDNETAKFFRFHDENMLTHKSSTSNFEWVTYPDGKKIYLLTVKSPLFDVNNNIIGLVGNSADITLQEQLYQGLKRAQSIAKLGSWEYDIVNDTLECSEEIYLIYGISDSNTVLSIADMYKHVHPDDIEKTKSDFQNFISSKKDFAVTNNRIIREKDGEIRFLEHRWNIEYQDDTTMKVIGTTQDITEQTNTLLNLKQKKKELETIIDVAPYPIAIHNEDGKILTLNKAWSDYSGYTMKDLTKVDDFIQLMVVDDMKIAMKEVIRNIYSLTEHDEATEYTILTKNKDKVIWQFSSASLGIIDGKRTVVTLAVDVTELKEKDNMIIQQSRHAAMGEMIAMIAHQWRQPISVISMDANNMLLDIALENLTTSEIENYAKSIAEQTQHLSKTIDDFRNFFKPDKKISRVNIKDVLDKTLSIVKDSLKNNNIMLNLAFETEKEIDAYERELMQVFVNIINNAKDAFKMNEKKEAVINIKVYEDKKYLNIDLCDNAGGIDKNILQKIFDPYFSTKDEKTGTGMGLYMSKMIIEDHLSGVLKVKNKDDGTCFTVGLLKKD